MFVTFFNIIPELILARAFLKGFWEFHWTGTKIPEKDPEGVNIHRVIVFSCEEQGHIRENRGIEIIYNIPE